MYEIFYNKNYGIIEKILYFDTETSKVLNAFCKDVYAKSIIDNSKCESKIIEDDKLISQEIFLYPYKFVYDETSNKILKRPFFNFKIFDENNNEILNNKLKINKEYLLQIFIENPDNISWVDEITKIKVKDRAKILENFLSSKILELDENKQCEIKIIVDEWGISKIRVKDINFLCEPSFLILKFI